MTREDPSDRPTARTEAGWAGSGPCPADTPVDRPTVLASITAVAGPAGCPGGGGGDADGDDVPASDHPLATSLEGNLDRTSGDDNT